MTKVELVVGPSRLEIVQRVLAQLHVDGVTVTEVKGRSGPGTERYRGAERPAALTPLLRVEVVIPTPLVPRAVHDLTRALREGRQGEDLLVAVPVLEALRVRTGERGEAAL